MDTPDRYLDALYWRDEVLQILYWLRGEGLGDTVTARELVPFLEAEESQVKRHLEQFVEEKFAERWAGDPARYRLTELGMKEGGRRFADEFAGLTGQAHGECNDPRCACRTMGPQACEARPANHNSQARSPE